MTDHEPGQCRTEPLTLLAAVHDMTDDELANLQATLGKLLQVIQLQMRVRQQDAELRALGSGDELADELAAILAEADEVDAHLAEMRVTLAELDDAEHQDHDDGQADDAAG